MTGIPDSSMFPLSDALLGIRWLAAFLALVGLPGYLLLGRFLGNWDTTSRLLVSLNSGLFALVLGNLLLSGLGIPLTWGTSGGVVFLAAVLLGRLGTHRRFASLLDSQIPPMPRAGGSILAALSITLATILIMGQHRFAAPPAFFDPNNHSFLVKGILDSRSVNAARIFSGSFAPPAVPYLVGWHGVAAMVADLSRVAPYVSAWYFSVAIAVSYPLAFSLLWRMFGLRPGAVVIATVLMSACFYLPVSIYQWGGFGAIIGMGLLPLLILLFRTAWRHHTITAAAAAALGLVAMIHVHTTEVFVALFFLGAALQPNAVDTATWTGRARAAAVFLGLVFGVGVLPLLGHVAAYNDLVAGMPQASLPLKNAVEQFVRDTGGTVAPLKFIVVLVLAGGWIYGATRRIYVLFIIVFALYLSLQAFPNPVATVLARPFYGQPARLLYLSPMLAYPLAGILAARGFGAIFRRWGKRPSMAIALAVTVLAAVFIAWPGWRYSHANLSHPPNNEIFDGQDYELAIQMRELAGLPARTGNFSADGSIWAMHISGLDFLDPCSWELDGEGSRKTRPVLPHLLDKPWPPEVLHLREMGVEFVWVSDIVIKGGILFLTCQELRDDPRFQVVLENDHSGWFRILWDKPEEDGTDPDVRKSGS